VIEKTKNTLDSALFTGVRDQVSKKFCDEWGINSVLGADVVFSSYFESYLEDDLIRVTHRESKKIGIIVRDWDWDEDGGRYYQPLIDLANSDSKYEFIIFAPYKDKVWLNKLAHKIGRASCRERVEM